VSELTKKKKEKIAKKFNFIMGIVTEGLGSQYGVFITTKTTIDVDEECKKETWLDEILERIFLSGDRKFDDEHIYPRINQAKQEIQRLTQKLIDQEVAKRLKEIAKILRKNRAINYIIYDEKEK